MNVKETKCFRECFSFKNLILMTALPVTLAACGGGGEDSSSALSGNNSTNRTVSSQNTSTVGFNILAHLDALRIATGPFAGAYQVGVGSNSLNWYFASIGLFPFIKERPSEVRDYMNVYIRNVDRSNYTINDVKFGGDTNLPIACPADSNDSYASSFLSLASEYLKVTGDVAWFRDNLPILKSIAYSNLAAVQKPNGLIPVFRQDYAPPTDPSYCPVFKQSDIAYTEDNTENYRGLVDFARALDSIGDGDSGYYKQVAASVSAGMQQLSNGTNFYAADVEQTVSPSFYPGTVTQVFPQLYDVPLSADTTATQSRYDVGYAYLNEHAPTWSTQIDPSAGYPWMLLGYVAAKRGDKARAQQQMALLRANTGKAIINELGFYKRILDAGVSES
ncbi:hypothetical protein [Cupriavidus sp. TA19]|uniref:hypothetical protein n=1 Tax=Cupriavidus sp. TA19 TaxID=701108 RepID=UPI00295F58D0|nr:hypothetical protein [Cupriavidus sp. TA19]